MACWQIVFVCVCDMCLWWINVPAGVVPALDMFETQPLGLCVCDAFHWQPPVCLIVMQTLPCCVPPAILVACMYVPSSSFCTFSVLDKAARALLACVFVALCTYACYSQHHHHLHWHTYLL
jgi:hypothetical protein